MSKETEKRIETLSTEVVRLIEGEAKNSRKFAELGQRITEQAALSIIDRNVAYSALCLVFNIMENVDSDLGIVALESIKSQAKKHLETLKKNERAHRLGIGQLDTVLSAASEELARATKR